LLTGRTDYTTPFSCTERYYERLEDASKHLIWFDHSAHFPFLEEPQRFAQALREVARDTESPPARP
jgi:pimeloyl-ACP methyl ester carboxylesterase